MRPSVHSILGMMAELMLVRTTTTSDLASHASLRQLYIYNIRTEREDVLSISSTYRRTQRIEA